MLLLQYLISFEHGEQLYQGENGNVKENEKAEAHATAALRTVTFCQASPGCCDSNNNNNIDTAVYYFGARISLFNDL